ncbi:FlhB-like flagellar biosynthesis protein [Persephonella sp. KM09-Lau-8]|uniref:FlhB-like flagellar biosynthesis protein n=1 Tax=Persephonella sp. KM09-Lau-8 TaxID=1158345 RepID=UPI000497A504|nr:FlhB-like flagellar biosynthesis protein [Persephonella sp. KM09-Lau-8]
MAEDKKAVALKYERGKDNAPKVIAKGKGHIGEKIIQIAKEHNIPIKEDPVLVEALSQIEINQEIPPELYKAVAEILAFVYRQTKKIEK